MEQAIFTRLAIFVFAVSILIVLLQFCNELGTMLKSDRDAHETMDKSMQDGFKAAVTGSYAAVVLSVQGCN